MTQITGRVDVNGVAHDVDVPVERPLLSWLRDDLGLTGAKYGCGEAACGACSVFVDGQLARACVVPMADVAGHVVTTIEGLSERGALHPVQRAFVDAGAMQCGFCTPGMVVAAVALLEMHDQPDDETIARAMAPNVCRCGTHPRIVAAIRDATGERIRALPLLEHSRLAT